MSEPNVATLDEIRGLTLAAAVPGVRLVGIDGPAASGKSTVAGALAARFGWPIVEIDDFFSWVGFDAWWPRFESQVVTPLLAGRAARYQVRDWEGDEFGEGLAGWKTLPWSPVVVLEGVGSTRSAVAAALACRVWVHAPAPVRLARGVARDGESHRRLWQDYLPRERAFFSSDGTAARADVRIEAG